MPKNECVILYAAILLLGELKKTSEAASGLSLCLGVFC